MLQVILTGQGKAGAGGLSLSAISQKGRVSNERGYL
jgi:hypothetical protein